MKPHHDFTAERAIAQHCPELFAAEASHEDQSRAIEQFTKRLMRQLQRGLAVQLGCSDLQISCDELGKRKAASLYKAIGPSAANVHLSCGDGELPLLLSFDFGAALALTEQAFGGAVSAIDSELAELPSSAWMVLETNAAKIAKSFAEAGELGAAHALIKTHENAEKLAAFGKSEACLVWPVTLTLPGAVELPFRIAASEEDVMAAIDPSQAKSAPMVSTAETIAANARRFGALPLPVHAVLAELTMPVSKIAAQKPGDFIPFSPRREVPLQTGSKTLACGKIGALDDQVALTLTQIL